CSTFRQRPIIDPDTRGERGLTACSQLSMSLGHFPIGNLGEISGGSCFAMQRTYAGLVLVSLLLFGNVALGDKKKESSSDAEKIALPLQLPSGAQGYLWLPKGKRPTTALLFAHPAMNYSNLIWFGQLIKEGFAILGIFDRGINADRITPIELVLQDYRD